MSEQSEGENPKDGSLESSEASHYLPKVLMFKATTKQDSPKSEQYKYFASWPQTSKIHWWSERKEPEIPIIPSN